ncbi:uncharacterized protein [Halyomorpha halys]|uniref:uncharacterized protein isoform X3 n=1 Tax=Halyomorpha halys TaxID=286706 RepID=UPI0034D1DCDC
MTEGNFNLCEIMKVEETEPVCARKSQRRPSEVLSYQQQILSQAKSLGQLRRHYVARKCYEDNVDERKALNEICQYKSCYPHCSELQLLQILLKAKACPDTIIYQTYVVESEQGKCTGADETFKKLRQRIPASTRKTPLLPCCPDENPIGSRMRKYGHQLAPKTQTCKTCPRSRAGSTSRQPSTYQAAPYPSRPPCVPQKPCSPCAAPLPCPGPIPPTPLPKLRRPPCRSPCPTPEWGQSFQASTPKAGAAGNFGSPAQTPAFFRSPGETPVTKRKTRIPVAIRQDLSKSQKRQPRDSTGSRIPCPISTQVPRSARFSRVQDEGPRGAQPCRRRDERPCGEQTRRKISFGGTQVTYFEDTLPSLVGVAQLEESQYALPLSPATLPQQPEQFQEFKSMIDQEKKEIREMHNVVTQLMDRPEKVEFRDMYSLVPQISYVDDTLADTAPEVAAAMLHSDELGLNMKSPPTEVYNTLFKGGDMDKTIIKVTPEENAKTVAPLSSEGYEATLLGYEQQGLFENINTNIEYDLPEMPQRKTQEDEDDEGEESDHTLKAEDDEQHAGEETEQQPGEEGSQEEIPPPRLSSIHSGESEVSNEALFDVQLQIDLQSTSDFLQVRGSQPPSWFPGYYVAMGDSKEINVARKPWDVLEKAWRKFEPSSMKPDHGTYVLGI